MLISGAHLLPRGARVITALLLEPGLKITELMHNTSTDLREGRAAAGVPPPLERAVLCAEIVRSFLRVKQGLDGIDATVDICISFGHMRGRRKVWTVDLLRN